MMRTPWLPRLAALLLMLVATSAQAQDWEQWLSAGNALRWQSDATWKINLALGLGMGPTYTYSRDTELKVLPLIDVEWRERIFASTQRGIGYNWINSGSTQAGPRITYDWGRKNSQDQFLENVDADDVKASPEVGFFWVRYSGPWRTNADVKHALKGAKGFHGAVGLAHGGMLSRNTNIVVGADVHYATKVYNFAYFAQGDNGINDVTPYLQLIRNFEGGTYLAIDGRVSFVLGPAHLSDISADRSWFAGAMFGKRF